MPEVGTKAFLAIFDDVPYGLLDLTPDGIATLMGHYKRLILQVFKFEILY